MGGRGAASWRYFRNGKWYHYGDEYSTIYQYRNIKFIVKNEGSVNTPMETMTAGRVYVTVRPDGILKSIAYYSGSGMRKKQIDLDHRHPVDGKPAQPHTHLGYVHEEHGSRLPNKREQKMIDRVWNIWQNRAKPH